MFYDINLEDIAIKVICVFSFFVAFLLLSVVVSFPFYMYWYNRDIEIAKCKDIKDQGGEAYLVNGDKYYATCIIPKIVK
jgi:hypothetical protein